MPHVEPLSGWGRYPVRDCAVWQPVTAEALHATLPPLGRSIARGNGRSYGDASLNPEATIDMPLPKILEASNSVTPSRKAARTTPNPETVWVDCFYYGFYMEKARLPAFQASLRQHQQASRPQVAGS